LFSFGGPGGVGFGSGCFQKCLVAAEDPSMCEDTAGWFPACETMAGTAAVPHKTMVAATEAMTCLIFRTPACLLMLLALRVLRGARLSDVVRKLLRVAFAALSTTEG
jgi:hypothetical protein